MFQTLWSSLKFMNPILLAGACCFTVLAQESESTRPVLNIDGNKVFGSQELLDVANQCLDRFTGEYETEQLDYCLQRVTSHMRQKGYLQATLGKTLFNQKDNVLQATIPVTEGALYRVGEIKIENAKVLAPAQIIDMIGLNTGDVADGEKLAAGTFEKVKKAYGSFGYIQYTAEINPKFHVKEDAAEGVVDIQITVEEGQQFKVRSIKFAGADDKGVEMLRRELMVRDGEIYNYDLFEKSIVRINNTGLYEPVDPNRDVDYRTNERAAYVDVTIKLKKRGATAVAVSP